MNPIRNVDQLVEVAFPKSLGSPRFPPLQPNEPFADRFCGGHVASLHEWDGTRLHFAPFTSGKRPGQRCAVRTV